MTRLMAALAFGAGCANPGVTLVASGPIDCADPGARADGPFEVRALDAPFEHDTRLWRNAGVVVADLTGDGALDLYLPAERRGALRVGAGDGRFEDETEARLPPSVGPEGGVGASAADVDGDGDLDLHLAASEAPDRLWLNDGAGFFTEAEGFPGHDAHSSVGSAWVDVDGDGDLDLFVATFRDGDDPGPPEAPDPNRLLENLGGGRFADASSLLPPEALEGYTWVASWPDVDADGDADLLLINDFGHLLPNRLFLNEGGAFVDASAGSGLQVPVCGMGLGIGDLNDDGLPELLTSNVGPPVLFESGGPGWWFEAHAARGLVPEAAELRRSGWGTELVDLDNDGRLDAVMSFGPLAWGSPAGWTEQPDGVWRQEDDGGFTQVAEDWGLAHRGVDRGVVAADLNGDGWPDLVTRDRDGPGQLALSRCGDAAWLSVALADEGPNRFGVGARVEVEVDGRIFWQELRAGGTSVSSSGPPVVHFGLGEAERIDALTVRWPDGEVSAFDAIEPRQRLTVTRAAPRVR